MANEIVGFIGLGDMGSPMAQNLARALPELHVFDLRTSAMSTALEAGAIATSSVAELTSRCSIVCVCVWDDEQFRNVVTGSDGILTSQRLSDLPLLVLVHGTVSPATMEALDKQLAEVGVRLVDAPVSGGHPASVAGELSLMVSGAAEDVARCRELFDIVGKNMIYVGDRPGLASVVKLCNNLMGGCINMAALEAMKLAATYGIPEDVIVEVASVSTGSSWCIQHWGFLDQLLLTHATGAGDDVSEVQNKDLRHAVEAAARHHLQLPFTAAAIQLAPIALNERRASVQMAHENQL